MDIRPTPPLNTNELLGISAVVSAVAWLLTWAFGFVLYSELSLGVPVIVLSLGWLVLTAGTGFYCIENTPDALKQLFVWRLWLWLSVAGSVINIGAGALLALGVVTSQTPIHTWPMEYGVILPWLIIYTVGYAVTAFYNWDDGALSKPERGIYAATAVISLVLSAALALDPTLHGPMIFAAAILSLTPLPTLYWR